MIAILLQSCPAFVGDPAAELLILSAGRPQPRGPNRGLAEQDWRTALFSLRSGSPAQRASGRLFALADQVCVDGPHEQPASTRADLAAATAPDGRRVIAIRGAREHNLKNVDVEIPRDQLVVFTGLSGSGKSSLAFDTIYAEGQRRYVESRCRPMPASSWR